MPVLKELSLAATISPIHIGHKVIVFLKPFQ